MTTTAGYIISPHRRHQRLLSTFLPFFGFARIFPLTLLGVLMAVCHLMAKPTSFLGYFHFIYST